MTHRWQNGKEPTKADVVAAITNAISGFMNRSDVDKIADAIIRLYKDRAEGKR